MKKNIIELPGLIGVKPKLTEDQMQIAEILKEALALTLEGKIEAVGIVVCLKTGYSTLIGGKRATELYTGCGSLQRRIMDLIEVSGAETQSRPT